MYYGMQGVGAVALGQNRPAWCPPTSLDPDNPQRDPCETAYKMKLPIVGDGTFKLPVSQMTNDAMYAATEYLPNYLPVYYQQLLPYINEQKASLMADVESWLPELVDDLIKEEVLPEVEKIEASAIAHAENLRDEALLALLGMTGTLLIAVATAAWWINRKETVRDRG